MMATEGVKLATAEAIKRLKKGQDDAPARSAVELASAADKMTRDMLTLSGRPQVIHETRSVTEIVRNLAAMGAVEIPEHVPVEAEAVEEDADAA
jgi:hypothetical protein